MVVEARGPNEALSRTLPHQVRTPAQWAAWAQAVAPALADDAELAWLADDTWDETPEGTCGLAPAAIAEALGGCEGEALRWIEVRERTGPLGTRRKVRIEARSGAEITGAPPRWRTNLDPVRAERALKATIRSSPAQPSGTDSPGGLLPWGYGLAALGGVGGCFAAIAAGAQELATALGVGAGLAGIAGGWVWSQRAAQRVRAGWGLGIRAGEDPTTPRGAHGPEDPGR